MPIPEPSRKLALALCLTAFTACQEASDLTPTDPPPEAPAPSQEQAQSLIGGFSANDPRLDSIGAMVLIPPVRGAPNEHLCGASVIAPQTLLTAKHCVDVIPLAVSLGYKLGFAVGPDIRKPKQLFELVDYEMAPGDVGGFVDYGHDVAVLHVDPPLPAHLKPLEIGVLNDEDVGKAFAAVGYGVQDNVESHGTRRLGRQTLRGREGRAFELLFGTFDRFLKWLDSGSASAKSLAGSIADEPPAGDESELPPLEEIARLLWDLVLIDKEYEVVTGGVPGDAQICFGDSGSSLVKYQDGKYVSYGVASGTVQSRELICDVGGVYATFGPDVAAFLDKAKTWVDPCGDLDTKGTCDGNVARRCTNLVEGRRRLVEFDCALVGMECNTLTGQVSCDGNAFAPPSPTPPPRAPTAPEIRKMVDAVFTSARKR